MKLELEIDAMPSIEAHHYVLGGIPCLRGERFSIAQLLAELAEGRNINDIANEFGIDKFLIKGALESVSIGFNQRIAKASVKPLIRKLS